MTDSDAHVVHNCIVFNNGGGFTHEDVRLLRSLSREAYDGSLPGGDRSRMLASLADRIAALLPPEVT